jgi:hypothetical protein
MPFSLPFHLAKLSAAFSLHGLHALKNDSDFGLREKLEMLT